MNNKIAITVTALALIGVFIINQETSEKPTEGLPIANDTQPSVTPHPVETANQQKQVNDVKQPQINQNVVPKNEAEILAADDKPLPPPPPVGIPPMASPANSQGVVSHPNQQAPVQAPISQSAPRKE